RASRRGRSSPPAAPSSPRKRRPSSWRATARPAAPARSATRSGPPSSASSAVLEHLLAPVRLGPVELPNRIASTAHQTTLVHDHLPTDEFVAYHEARAARGTGMIVLEATAVHESGRLTAHTLAGYQPEIVAGYPRPVEALRPHGARVLVQR